LNLLEIPPLKVRSLNQLIRKSLLTTWFLVKKCVTLVNILATSAGVFFNPAADKYVKIMFDNANTGFAEVRIFFWILDGSLNLLSKLRNAFCHTIRTITQNQWRPWHPSVQAFLLACSSENDPLLIR
jgi:proteasome activator subunit 4